MTGDLYPVGGAGSRADAGALAAAVLGPVRVLPLEHPHLACRAIDVDPARPDVPALLAEVLDPAGEPVIVLRGRHRWRPVYQPVRLEPAEPVAPGRGYLITGGLGGVGLALARRLARTERAALALVGRTPLPPRDRWAAWLAAHPHDATSVRIRAVREIEADAGRPVAVLVADVTDAGQVRAALALAAEEIGPIHTVVHAAGVAGGGLIQLKDPATAERVLAPKVAGAVNLAAAARDAGVPVLVLCSSTLALTGAVGQVDYVAANAVLDALAQRSAAAGDPGPEIVSVNWDAWQDVGMAHRHLGGGGHPVDHPLLERRLDGDGTHAVYTATVDPTSWLVDEHRMLDVPVVPGTGHLELARAAFADLCGAGPVELSDVRFHAPAVVGNGPLELRVVLDRGTDPMGFTVISPYPGERWQVHATGRVAHATGAPSPAHDPAPFTAALPEIGPPAGSGPMGYGPRSRCVRRMWRGERTAVAELELPERYAADLDHLVLHPSLLDLAAGFVGVYLAGEFRIPIGYGRLRCRRPLTRRLFSIHRYREADWAGRETCTADITLVDEDGIELATIEEFVLKRVPALRETLDRARDGTAAGVAFFRYPAPAGTGVLGTHLAAGIRPDEGADAFQRILAAGIGPQVVVATRDIAAIAAEIAAGRAGGEVDVAPARSAAHPRPNVLTAYRAPGDDLERQLVEVWQELLGLARVGVDDMFADLGGHSLLGLELVNRLHRRLGVAVPLGVLFEARTVAELARVVRPMTGGT